MEWMNSYPSHGPFRYTQNIFCTHFWHKQNQHISPIVNNNILLERKFYVWDINTLNILCVSGSEFVLVLIFAEQRASTIQVDVFFLSFICMPTLNTERNERDKTKLKYSRTPRTHSFMFAVNMIIIRIISIKYSF